MNAQQTWSIHTRKCYSAFKRGTLDTSNMDEPGKHYAKGNTSNTEGQLLPSSLMQAFLKSQNSETESRRVDARAVGRSRWRLVPAYEVLGFAR